ncbi:MAG: T9SS type A sorting domain-containing protein [Bacteroidetes bacterium]|nr:T9SS type A sorting domain-containing protein [Bacteroidota bacterium]
MKPTSMKKFTIALVGLFLLTAHYVSAQTVWTGSKMTFTKSDSADWTQEANQDRITDNVWITRAHNQGIFNIQSETVFTKFSSPAGTEWAFGKTENKDTMTFSDWQTAVGGNPASMVGKNVVLHLKTDDIYIDIKFTSYTGSNKGGGFSYERSTKPNVGIGSVTSKTVSIVPNPANSALTISGLTQNHHAHILDLSGKTIWSGNVSPDQSIDVAGLTPGMYWIKLQDGSTLRFSKY